MPRSRVRPAKTALLAWRSGVAIRAQGQVFAGKGHKSPIFGKLALGQKEISGQSVPKMGFSDLVLEKHGRRFHHAPVPRFWT